MSDDGWEDIAYGAAPDPVSTPTVYGSLSAGANPTDIFVRGANSTSSVMPLPYDTASPSTVNTSADDGWEDVSYGTSVQTEPTSFLNNVWEGVKDSPAALYNAATSIPSGISNLYNTVANPVESLENGTAETTFRGAGGLGAGIAGAGTGALFGSVFGPIGTGVGAAFGGAAGLLGFNKLNQLTGADEATTGAQDIDSLGYATGQGLGGTALAKSLGVGTRLAGRGVANRIQSIQEAPEALRERALGVQYGNKSRGLSKSSLYVNEAGEVLPWDQLDDASKVEAPIQQQVKLLNDKGYLKNAPDDAGDLKIHLSKQAGGVGKTIQSLAKEADEVTKGETILPQFTETTKFLDKFREGTRASLEGELNSIIDDYRSEPGQGFQKLSKYLDKIQEETNFDQLTPKNVTTLKRLAAYDLRNTLESSFDEAVPNKQGAFAEANKDYSAIKTIEKVLNKRVPKDIGLFDYLSGGSKPAAALTGGLALGLDLAAAAKTGGATILANALRVGAENKYPLTAANVYESIGNNAVVRGIKGTASVVGETGNKVSQSARNIGASGAAISNQLSTEKSQSPTQDSQKLQKGYTSSTQNEAAPAASQLKAAVKDVVKAEIPKIPRKIEAALERNPASKTNVKALIEKQHPLVQSVIAVESAGNPKAVSKTGPKGLMQLTGQISRAFGVKDAFDPVENIRGGTELLKEVFGKFKDPYIALAAYNQGEPEIRAAMRQARLAGKNAEKWESIKPYLKVEGQKYPELVDNAYKQINNKGVA